MAVVKQITTPSGTVKLKQLKNDMKHLSNNQYKYVVEFEDGDRTDPRFTEDAGMAEFNRVVRVRGGKKSGTSVSYEEDDSGGILDNFF